MTSKKYPKFIMPDFDKDWELAKELPKFKDLTKKQWIILSKVRGKTIPYSDIKDKILNTELNFDEHNQTEKDKFIKEYDSEMISIPLVIRSVNNIYTIVTGNATIAGLVKNNITDFPMWTIPYISNIS
jgi:hypothetical protein